MNERAYVNRLGFLKGLAAGTAMPLTGCRNLDAAVKRPTVAYARGCCTVISPLVREPVSFFLVGDTHMTLNDDRGNDYLRYTERMGGKRRESASEADSFRKTLALAKESKVDLVTLVGDQISFPTWAGVEFLRRELDAAGVPWLYTSGNHDWHFEGMPGTENDLREKYEKEILAPLYSNGADPLCFTRIVKGIRFVAIDDSTHEILPQQLDYWRREVATGDPIVLLMHIPLYIPGYCVGEAAVGHPEWGAKTDPYYKIERRPQWPEEGASKTTLAFRREVFAAPNLLGVFTGHEHVFEIGTSETGAVQIVCPSNRANAEHVVVRLLPAPESNPPVKVLPPPKYVGSKEDVRGVPEAGARTSVAGCSDKLCQVTFGKIKEGNERD